MKVDLLPHNQEAMQEINEMLEKGIKRIAAPRATGSGKTYLMGALAEQYNNEKKLVLEPTRPLLDSIKEKFDEFGIANTDFMTYQKLIRISDEDIAAMDYKLIFLDECHHSTTPKWGQKIDCLMSTHSDSIIFGTSATTVRNDGVNVVETIFEGNAIGELPLSTAIARKVLPCPHYITAIYRLDDELDKLRKKVENATNTKAEKKEFIKKIRTMQSHFEKSYGIPLILNKYIKEKNGKYLVFCKDKKHLDAMRDVVIGWFKTAGIKDVHSYAVYSDYPDKEKDYKEFQEDNSDSAKILFSINMLNEGLHIDDISGLLMLRTTQSNLIYLQQLGRLLGSDNMDKYLLVFDFVNNFSSVNDGIGLLKEIKDAIEREKEGNPDFDDSWSVDIDTFFVIEQVREIQELFAEIEGRLQGSWDLYIKALTQFKEREGDCDVSSDHVEVVDGENVKLGQWCYHIRMAKGGKGDYLLSPKRENQLNEIDFIWDVHKYRFERKVIDTKSFILENGHYPRAGVEDKSESNLGCFISAERTKRRQAESGKGIYPNWKLEIINREFKNFSWNPMDESFNTFLHFFGEYKKETGKNYVEKDVTFKGYELGKRYKMLKTSYEKNMPEYKKRKLKSVGFFLGDVKEDRYKKNWKLLEECADNNIVLTSCNGRYKGVDLCSWARGTVKSRIEKGEVLSDRQKEILDKVFKKQKAVKVIDLSDNETYLYVSINRASEALYNYFCVAKTTKSAVTTIKNHLDGKIITPYKGRFKFYPIDDESVNNLCMSGDDKAN